MVSHGTGSPSGPGRVGTRSCSTAYTCPGSQPSRSGTCSTCMPRSLRTPFARRYCACRFQLIGLLQVEVARVAETAVHLDDPAERPRGDACDRGLRAGEERQLAGAADERLRVTLHGSRIACAAARSMPNGFSAAATCRPRSRRRTSARAGRAAPRCRPRRAHPGRAGRGSRSCATDRRDAVEPRQGLGVDVADVREHRAHRVVGESRPPGERDGDLLAHQAAADDADADRLAGRRS